MQNTIFSTFNKARSIFRKAVLFFMDNEGFEYSDEEEKAKITKQYLEVTIITFAIIELILDQNQNLKNKYKLGTSQLIVAVLEQMSEDKYLRNHIGMESDAFFSCLIERIELYKREVKNVIESTYFQSPYAIFYYFLLDPGNIWTTAEYSNYEEFLIKDVFENRNEPTYFDEVTFVVKLKEVYNYLDSQII